MTLDPDRRSQQRLLIKPSCYFCTSFPVYYTPARQSWTSLLACSRELHRRGMTIFYQHATISIDLDRRKCNHEDSTTTILARHTLLPYIQGIDLMIEPYAEASPDDKPEFYWKRLYCRMDRERSMSDTVLSLRAALPNAID